MSPTEEELKRMEDEVDYWAKMIYGEDRFFVDKKQRKIKDHLHWHIRQK